MEKKELGFCLTVDANASQSGNVKAILDFANNNAEELAATPRIETAAAWQQINHLLLRKLNRTTAFRVAVSLENGHLKVTKLPSGSTTSEFGDSYSENYGLNNPPPISEENFGGGEVGDDDLLLKHCRKMAAG